MFNREESDQTFHQLPWGSCTLRNLMPHGPRDTYVDTDALAMARDRAE